MAKSTPLVCRGHTRPIPSLAFSPIDKEDRAQPPHYLLVSSCKDGVPMLRLGFSGDWLGSFIGHKGCAWAIKLSPNTERAITGSADFTANVWSATDGAVLLTLPHEHIVRAVDLNYDGSRAVTGGHEKKLRLWDVDALLRELEQASAAAAAAAASSNDGLPSATTDGTSSGNANGNGSAAASSSTVTSVTTIPSKEALEAHVRYFVSDPSSASRTAHEGNIKSVIWDGVNEQIVSMGEDRTVKFWELATLECVKALKCEAPITSMERCHDPKGSIVITYGNKVEFIDPKSRQVYLSHTLSYQPSSASLHPIHQRTFVTGAVADGWVRVHDATTGQELETSKGHHGPVHSISYSPDGELYASASEDGTIRLMQTVPKTYGLWRFDGPAAGTPAQ